MQGFQEAQEMSVLDKYQDEIDRIADMIMQNSKERHTKHLKRDEVSTNTYEAQMRHSASTRAFQLKDADKQFGFADTITPDPI